MDNLIYILFNYNPSLQYFGLLWTLGKVYLYQGQPFHLHVTLLCCSIANNKSLNLVGE